MTEKQDNILLQQLKKNYQHLSDFKTRSGCPLALETIRKAIYENKPLSIPVLLTLVKYLGFPPQEIKKIIKEAGDKDYYPLIGDSAPLSEGERGLLAAVSAIKDKDPQQLNNLADHINLIGRASGIDIKETIDKLRVPKRSFFGGHEKRKKKKP